MAAILLNIYSIARCTCDKTTNLSQDTNNKERTPTAVPATIAPPLHQLQK